ncbi:hypothetical protein LIER_12022 [Lithospermum erythrorhizon]|uniref:Uncharacterized protein n=1 Tax=Lithospermum erythrorhizon TaxID=34254 RepID=A0AAV3PQ80_LITER
MRHQVRRRDYPKSNQQDKRPSMGEGHHYPTRETWSSKRSSSDMEDNETSGHIRVVVDHHVRWDQALTMVETNGTDGALEDSERGQARLDRGTKSTLRR